MWISQSRYYQLCNKLIELERKVQELEELKTVRVPYDNVPGEYAYISLRGVFAAISKQLGMHVIYTHCTEADRIQFKEKP